MQFETAGAAPFILTGVKNADQFRDVVLQQRDSMSPIPQQSTSSAVSTDVLVEIRDILQEINANLSNEE
jgi:hypothetical protein